MKLKRLLVAAVVTVMALGCGAAGIPEAQQVFWSRLQSLCGAAFEGRVAEAPASDEAFVGQRMVMHVSDCSEDEVRIPLHVGEDRSRTWIVTRTAAALRLKHDHRHPDGTLDSNTDYGGDTALPGSIWRQEFPADAYSVDAVPARDSQLWYLEVRPDDAFIYGLRREATGLRYRFEFDLTSPVEPPAPPWAVAPERATRGAAVTEVAVDATPAPIIGTSFAEAREAEEARIAFFYVPSSGFAYRDEDGNLTGVTVELLRDFAGFVAESHGIELEVSWLEEARWADFYGYVRDSEGGVFGVGNVTITQARREELDFSPPYLNNVAVLVTHERVPELVSMDEIGEAFRGLTGLPYPGTLHEARLEAIRDRYLPDMATRAVASNDEIVARLASDDLYFGYMDVYNYWRAREAGTPLRRHPVGDDGSETFGVILPRGSDWTPVIEAFFETEGGYAESPRFRELLRRHLGDELANLLSGG